MLVLGRRVGEVIVVGDIKITVEKVEFNRVRLGIEAPPDVKILREELLTRKEQSGKVFNSSA